MTRARPSLLVFLLSTLAGGCGGHPRPLDGSGLDIDGLCSLSAAAHAKQDFNDLIAELARQARVERIRIRVAPEGVFVPVNTRYVEESGYFLAGPGAVVKADGTDPSFEPLRTCVYRYRIKG